MSSGEGSHNEPSDGFETTAWSLVLAAGQGGDGGRSLEQLCQKHWRPIYVFIRRSGMSPADAEDLTQDFFVYLLEREWIKRADPERGSFRAYLLALLRNFLANERRARRAEKRGGQSVTLSFATADGERELAALATTAGDPARAYEASWARDVLDVAWQRLRQEQDAAGKLAQFEALRPFVTQAPNPGEYERLTRELGLRHGQAAVMIHRLSRRFAELIRREVAETLADRSLLEAELRRLLEASG